MNLWVDDLRPPPGARPMHNALGKRHGLITWSSEWTWAKTSSDALDLLDEIPFDLVSLDHDLGGDDTTRPIVLWWCEHPWAWPTEVRVHSANPVGREWLEGMIERYKP